MTLPRPRSITPASARSLQHRRHLSYDGWLRDDGLWEIEGELVDRKPFEWMSPGRGLLHADAPVHFMRVRVAFDNVLVVREAQAELLAVPYAPCCEATLPVGELVGARLAGGWRRAIESALGKTLGCSHLRELLFGVGTVAIQVLGEREYAGTPPHLGTCISWHPSSPVTRAYLPAHYVAPPDLPERTQPGPTRPTTLPSHKETK